MTSGNLINKLRNTATQYGYEMHDLLIDAADDLEQLTIDNKNLGQDLKEAGNLIRNLGAILKIAKEKL